MVFPSADVAAAGASKGHSGRPLSSVLSWVAGAKDLPPSVERERKIWRFAFGSRGLSRHAIVGLPTASTAIPGGQFSQTNPVMGVTLPTFLPCGSIFAYCRLWPFLVSTHATWRLLASAAIACAAS